jgi:1,4-alpha-glucan branching enzyme
MPHHASPDAEAIVAARHGDPFGFLGMHEEAGLVCVRAFLPDGEAMAVVDSASGALAATGKRIRKLPIKDQLRPT